jgi:hypothetical protein
MDYLPNELVYVILWWVDDSFAIRRHRNIILIT